MNLPQFSPAAIFAALLLAAPFGLFAQNTTPPPANPPPAPASATLQIELTEAGAGTPTVIEIPRKLLAGLPGVTADSDNASGTSLIAGTALSAALMLGGLHFFKPKRVLNAPAAILLVGGLLALTAGLLHGDILPPSVRHAPLVAGHVTVKVVETGGSVHIVASRELLKALLEQPPPPK